MNKTEGRVEPENNKEEEGERRKEILVGISEWMNNVFLEGEEIQGEIKRFYSDFKVNEIDAKGVIAKNKGNKDEENKQEFEPKKKKRESEVESVVFLSKYNSEILNHLSGEELDKVLKCQSGSEPIKSIKKFDDKQARTGFHYLMKNAFQNTVETKTLEDHSIEIRFSGNKQKRKNYCDLVKCNEDGSLLYENDNAKKYLHFTVCKKNRETMEVARNLAKQLHIPILYIGFAGNKDRRGVTCQRFSIERGKLLKVSSIRNSIKNITLSDFLYSDDPINLGDLKGNDFTITIRNVKLLNSNNNLEFVFEKCFNSLKKKGFFNYFGLQRFGSFSVSTHHLGVKILQNDWKGVVDLILSEQDVVAPDSVVARKIWISTHDPKATLKKFPLHYSAEVSILKSLEKEKKDTDKTYSTKAYFRSVESIPKRLRSMYLHLYQSYVWNTVLTKRIKQFGLDLLEGDLVLIENDDSEGQNKTDVKVVTKEDIETKKYSIYDVVMPTPGFKIFYPKNDILINFYNEVMKADNLNPSEMKKKNKNISLSGNYRKILEIPKNLSYTFLKYRTDEELLSDSDDSLLHKSDTNLKYSTNNEEFCNTEKIAIIIKMQLAVCSYATMALREVVKTFT